MSIANAKLADQLVDAWNSLDPQRVADVLTEDHIYEDVTFAVICRNAAETRGFFEAAYSAFPDIAQPPRVGDPGVRGHHSAVTFCNCHCSRLDVRYLPL